MAVLFPATYIKWREPLCVWSHVLHKLAQTAVTLVPPMGTIFSRSYNPTVALLESSSLAQIHMLSFGLKLRFGTHLLVDLFHFAAAVAANDQICAAGFPFVPGACRRAARAGLGCVPRRACRLRAGRCRAAAPSSLSPCHASSVLLPRRRHVQHPPVCVAGAGLLRPALRAGLRLREAFTPHLSADRVRLTCRNARPASGSCRQRHAQRCGRAAPRRAILTWRRRARPAGTRRGAGAPRMETPLPNPRSHFLSLSSALSTDCTQCCTCMPARRPCRLVLFTGRSGPTACPSNPAFPQRALREAALTQDSDRCARRARPSITLFSSGPLFHPLPASPCIVVWQTTQPRP